MQKNHNRKNVINTVILGIVAIVALVALVLSIFALWNVSGLDRATIENGLEERVEMSKVKFCHDKQIIPCDDVSIEEWNAKNPEDAWNIPQL